jgi:Flp pilus assembly protein TadG
MPPSCARVFGMVRSRRGQALVLGCLTMLLLAVSVLISFNLGNAVHERIRLQAHADAVAFSLATLEARAMNTAAYTNRALASAVNGQMTMHAYLAIGYHSEALLNASADGFLAIAAKENNLSRGCVLVIHCAHRDRAQEIANQLRQDARELRRSIRDSENAWQQAVGSMQGLANVLSDVQSATFAWTRAQLAGGQGSMLEQLRLSNAPRANEGFDVDNLAHRLSVRKFGCAVEGIEDGSGWLNETGCPNLPSTVARDTVAANNVLATRPYFTDGATNHHKLPNMAHQDFVTPDGVDPRNPPTGVNPSTDSLMQIPAVFGLQGSGYWGYLNTNSMGFLGNQPIAFDPYAGSTQVVGARVEGRICISWGNGALLHGDNDANTFANCEAGVDSINNWAGPVRAEVRSARGQNGFAGLPCSSSDACLVGFRPETADDSSIDVYGSVRQKLRGTARQGSQAAYERDPIEVRTAGSPWGIMLSPVGDVFAASKAKAYFHQLNDYRAPPNAFDPFWRAKLHRFRKCELAQVLTESGDAVGAATAARPQVPTEGSRQDMSGCN